MREIEHLIRSHKHQKFCSWSKLIARKWLSRNNNFDSDYYYNAGGPGHTGRRKSCSDRNSYLVVPDDVTDESLHSTKEDNTPKHDSQNFKMFVGTWNVAGKSPTDDLVIRNFLHSPADVYVLGFQEIVPLNAGNVLGSEDQSPAAEWLSLISCTLNTQDEGEDPNNNEDDDFETFHIAHCRAAALKGQDKYCLVVSKQMVGLFLCVWVKSDLVYEIGEIKVSCVGRGIMGCLGNKGSVSISMMLGNTSYCIVCTHLASGEKECNGVRRNLDVLEILRKTRFGQPFRDRILDHDNVIWLGDLNYRMSCDRAEMYELIKHKDWQALLEKDQLKMEQRAGRVFKGWNEGIIRFAPTYKYLPDSDYYVSHFTSFKEKPRSPAWCDRILWKGDGLKQIVYDRDENKFSDHRPVYSIFTAHVDKHEPKFKPLLITDPTKSGTLGAARIRTESLFMLTRVQSCTRGSARY